MSQLSGCHQKGCEVGSTGNCLEGFSPASVCPYLRGESKDTEATPSKATFVDLPAGKALSPIDANGVTREARTKIIFIAGDHDSGKTTLLTSIYESFQDAPFAGYQFAGSTTLHGWEERAHDGRTDSGRNQPHTEHTKIGEGVKFLHLQLSPLQQADPFDLLFSDVSGETFKKLRDSEAAVASLALLSRVDIFCVILDGERLTRDDERFVARNNVRTLLRSLHEGNALKDDCRIFVVVSKWDAVVTASEPNTVVDFVNDSVDLYKKEFPKLSFCHVAARPLAELSFAHGVAGLLKQWCENVERRVPAQVCTPNSSTRHFGRFANVKGQSC